LCNRRHNDLPLPDDLASVLAPLRAAGMEVLTQPEWDDPCIGKFDRVLDPECNPIELWEPPKGE
jgi:hypothetical protein